jgi:divinyl protochlorophyllide a 8-vinyl-reductase
MGATAREAASLTHGRRAAPPRRAAPGAGANPAGRMGPNAVTRLAEALDIREGREVCRHVFAAAGLLGHLDDPPTHMVDEADVARLHRALVADIGPRRAAEASWVAGRLTGDYLLAHRIPAPAQAVLRLLPRRLAAALLAKAIARHSWTFAGSGSFSYAFQRDPQLVLALSGSPVCRLLRTQEPACHYFAGAFECVFAAVLGPTARVTETRCEAAGDTACRFEVRW